MPFLLAVMSWIAWSHRCSGKWLSSKIEPIAHGEGLPAGVTLAQARTARFPGQATDSLVIAISAMGTNRAFGPQMGLDVGESGLFVVEMGGG